MKNYTTWKECEVWESRLIEQRTIDIVGTITAEEAKATRQGLIERCERINARIRKDNIRTVLMCNLPVIILFLSLPLIGQVVPTEKDTILKLCFFIPIWVYFNFVFTPTVWRKKLSIEEISQPIAFTWWNTIGNNEIQSISVIDNNNIGITYKTETGLKQMINVPLKSVKTADVRNITIDLGEEIVFFPTS